MAKISYVNGRYILHRDALVHMEDRGYQFSDGIYEVIAFYNRTLLDADLHLKRLTRSLQALAIVPPLSMRALAIVMAEVIARNDRTDGTIYMQISRGVAKRDHPFPRAVRPSLVMSVTGPKWPKPQEVTDGTTVTTTRDQRWARRDIKSISLLANVLAKQEAVRARVREAWFLNDKGLLTEGAVSNNAIVNGKGEIITHPEGEHILSGITRAVVMRLAQKSGIKIVERAFSLKEAKAAKEAFLTSTTSNVLPVVRIDGAAVAGGKPGPVTRKLQALYYDHIFKQTGKLWN